MAKKDPLLKEIRAIAMAEHAKALKTVSFSEKEDWTQLLEDEYHDVPIETLLDDKDFFNTKDWLYPCHREDLSIIFQAKKKYDIETVIDIEGIGSGKSKKFNLLLAIQIYKSITLVDPQKHFGAAPGDPIAYILMSRTETQAKKVAFKKLLPIFDCPFFNQYFTPKPSYADIERSRKLPAELRFPKNIVVFPGTGSAASALGYDIQGAVIDEANYLEVTTESKKMLSGSGTYDAAEQMHHEIYNRMTSRYMTKGGSMPGFIVMFSNPRYIGDFLERWARSANLTRLDDNRWIDIKGKMLLIRRATWEAKRHVYGSKTFKFNFKTMKVM